jgi:hypothetical protein
MTVREYHKEHGVGVPIGMHVRIVGQSRYKKDKLIGQCACVIKDCHLAYGTITVSISDMHNCRSASGYYYFSPSELEILENEKENENMNIITNYLNIAKIQYLDNTATSRYDYANFDPELKEGDLCVVKSAHHGLGLAKVVEIQDRNDVELQREIVAKVDTTAFDERVGIRKQAAELKAKMQERAKQLQDIALYQMLAKEDSEMMSLLGQFQSLPKI